MTTEPFTARRDARTYDRRITPLPAHRAGRARRPHVPIIRIEMLQGRSLAQKRELVRVLTESFCNIAQADPEHTTVVITEYPAESWAMNGKLYIDHPDDENDD